MAYRYWYSTKQSRCWEDAPAALRALMLLLEHRYGREPKTRALVTLSVAGETVELEYTECSQDPAYWPNWDDAVLLGETDNFPVRIEELAE